MNNLSMILRRTWFGLDDTLQKELMTLLYFRDLPEHFVCRSACSVFLPYYYFGAGLHLSSLCSISSCCCKRADGVVGKASV